MTDLDKRTKPEHSLAPTHFDPAPLKASLSEHAHLLRDHGQLESIESTIATLEQGFSNNSKAFIAKSKDTSVDDTQAKLGSLADKMLARGHQIISRAVENCEEKRAFDSAYQASITRYGALCTTEEVAAQLNVSPWHVDAIMGRAGAKKVHVAGVGKSMTRAFWRLEDCRRARRQRNLN